MATERPGGLVVTSNATNVDPGKLHAIVLILEFESHRRGEFFLYFFAKLKKGVNQVLVAPAM